MGTLSDIFIANEDSVPDYDAIQKLTSTELCRLSDTTPLQLAQWLAVLRGCKYSNALMDEFKLVTPEDADEWTFLIPAEMTNSFASLTEDQLGTIAPKFAKATHKELQWSAGEYVPLLRELAVLARHAQATGKSMFLWCSV